MDKELIGVISGALVACSIIPYACRTYQGKICPQVASWFLWSIVGFTLLLTYKNSGAEANVWPAVFGFINPLIITFLAIRAKEKNKRFNFTGYEWACIVIVIFALLAWTFLDEDSKIKQYLLYGTLIANTFAAVRTILFIRENPDSDRPFAWALFGLGYGLALFSIKDQTTANYTLPIYMVTMATWIVTILILHRIKNRIPIREWI